MDASGGPLLFVDQLKARALELGFDAVGVAPALTPPGYDHFLDWLEAGCAAGMTYLERHAEARSHPRSIHFEVKSVVMVAMVYGRPQATEPNPGQGRIARYAQGLDYHHVLWDKLDRLLAWVQEQRPALTGRSVVDSAPLLERDFARLAGLGWIAKNTMLIHPRLGSFTVLGALLLDCELPADSPFLFDRCGTCTRCLDACPTSAFTAPGRLDARRCISYWTIEHKGMIPEAWAEQLHGWVFGCDICQEVCPWNRKAPAGREPALEAREGQALPDLLEWLTADADEFRRWIRGTPLQRSKRVGLVRNAVLLLGSRRMDAALPALIDLLNDPEPTIRASAAWAIGRYQVQAAHDALAAHSAEPDATVRDAVERAILVWQTGQT